jgi:hypothetical protein
MRSHRVTTRKLAVLVAVVALNLGVGRALYVWWGEHRFVRFNLGHAPATFVWRGYRVSSLGVHVHIEPEIFLYVLAPMGLAGQLAAYRIFRVRGPARVFWVAFLVCGLAAAGSLIWAFMADDAIAVAWYPYLVRVPEWTHRAGLAHVLFGPRHSIGRGVCFAYIFGFPQFLAALSGGLAARIIARWWGRRHSRPASGQLPSTP